MFTIRYPEDLPISTRRVEIIDALRAHQVLVIAGETGSGKTTQLPKMCLDAGWAEKGVIGCTQPRRVAALSVSRRVAEELAVPWGREVGCKMRFQDDTSRETRIKFMTDGILLAEVQSNPTLRGYSAIILDEAHERSLNIDFLLGYLPGLLRQRPDLKLIITSATIDTATFSKAFGDAPVIEVSGRLFPVEIRYAPAGSLSGEGDPDISHIEAAVRATEEALIESDDGDVLVFMPTERDIRETRELLEGGLGFGIEVIGLFGRMPTAEQQRIFAPGDRRRVIIATNIAETSITLPRIRYVIDTGLARVSRYNPRTRTKRLPVEEVSQSSANQRSGRAGRVQNGTCIRLYEQEDFEKRPRFTQPEIQRANLAEVILRMKAFRLGRIETFPFLNPPPAAAIRSGYQLLHELGALNDTDDLTPLGHELARLPVDPTLGRMLLQGREEGSLPELLIIAAGLSVPDPRERPEEQKEAAAAAHRVFADPDSDFLTLLNIWRAAPALETRGSANAIRKFCKANFLSAARVREWRDIYHQLADAVQEQNPSPTAARNPEGSPRRRRTNTNAAPDGGEVSYSAIHRAILSALLGHIAQRQERNTYKFSGNRLVTLFPGSDLYERRDPRRKKPAAESGGEKTHQPAWIVAGEIVETSQLFARTAAGINPEWVLDVGAHLCEYRYTEPHWSAKAGRVLVLQRVLVHGLEITRSLVDYGRINPAEATELFIRGALVAEEARLPLRFFQENQKVREKIENALTRVRSRRAHDLEESLYQFYAARIDNVSSIHDLNRLVRERITKDPNFLCATEADLIGDDDTTYDRTLFPDRISLGNTALPLTYSYAPGEEKDGVTVRVPLPVAEHLSSGQVQWMVPGLRHELVEILLRALPKSVRKSLMPLDPKIREVVSEFQPGRGDFLDELSAFLSRKYRVPIRPEDWPPNSLPAHLRPRVEVFDRRNQTVAAGRDLSELRAEVERKEVRSDAWERAAKEWGTGPHTSWNFGDLPETIVVEQIGGIASLACPGLQARDGSVYQHLFRNRAEAETASGPAVRRLAELVLARDLAHVWKELAGLSRHLTAPKKQQSSFHDALHQVTAKIGAPAAANDPEILRKSAYEHLLAHSLALAPALPLAAARFDGLVQSARRELPGLAYKVGEWTGQILGLRNAILSSPKRYPGVEHDLERLVPPDFLARTPHRQLPHLHRYLRAMQVRAERATLQPAKDKEKALQLAPFASWEQRVPAPTREDFRWLLEEFRVSIFAQELGTVQPVSAQRLKTLGGL